MRNVPALFRRRPEPAPAAWYITLEAEERNQSLKPLVAAGAITVAVAFGTFFAWAFGASLDSAAIAGGTVVVDSHRKTITHLEGGILQEMLVREGERVTAGQALLRLDGTFARSTLDQLRSQRLGVVARLARLRAEQADQRDIVFPDQLEAGATSQAADVISTERRLFHARWQDFDGRIAIEEKRIEQFRSEMSALDGQIDANRQQLALVEDELAAVRSLYEKGYERRPRLLELQGRVSELTGRASELAARRAQAEQSVAAAQLTILSLQTERRAEIAKSTQEAQLQLAEITDQMAAAENVLRRTEVVSPQDGFVTDIQVHTPGGVIGAGQPILDIVPGDDPMLIEARILPRDIESVRIGLPVEVKLTAYNQKTLAPLDGKVTYISADRQIDPINGEPYFIGRVEITPESLKAAKEVSLYPGMPAEVVIVTGERRAIDYLISPITDSMNRAFREE